MKDDYRDKIKSKFKEEKKVFLDEIEQLKETIENLNEVKEINAEQTDKLKELFEAGIIDGNLQIINKID